MIKIGDYIYIAHILLWYFFLYVMCVYVFVISFSRSLSSSLFIISPKKLFHNSLSSLFAFVMFEVKLTRSLLYLHFTRVVGGMYEQKKYDDQIARSRSVQAIQFVSILMMLREFLVSWQHFFILFQYANYSFFVPAPSYEYCTILESIYIVFFKPCFKKIEREKNIVLFSGKFVLTFGLGCSIYVDLHGPIQIRHHRWHQESLFYLDI